MSFLLGVYIDNVFNIPEASSRLEAYKIANQLPLGLRQLIKAANLVIPLTLLVISIAIIQRHSKGSWLIWFFIIY